MNDHILVTDMTYLQARSFFRDKHQYTSIDLPPYLDFDDILLVASVLLDKKSLKGMCIAKEDGTPNFPANFEDVNYVVLGNKDGGFAWRVLQLIHPILYMDLVNTITEKTAWNEVKSLFKRRDKTTVECISVPLKSNSKESHKAETVTKWWEKIEQESLRLSLDYKFMFQTDVSNCYPSIYTHSIEWAFNESGRLGVKTKRAKNIETKNLGTSIDIKLRNMNQGQTIGIPQGSTLMDFIAEMVMAGIDIELTKVLDNKLPKDAEYKILRYRDDYRIFTSEYNIGHEIMKQLNTVLFNWNMKMNSSKTSETSDIISASIKKEKLDEIYIAPINYYFQKQALRIYLLSKKYPNSGLIAKKLTDFFDKIKSNKKHDSYDHEVVIAIITMIAYNSPRYMPQFASIISEIIASAGEKLDRKIIIRKIMNKFKEVPNTELIDMWLQRITDKNDMKLYEFDSSITKVSLNEQDNSILWNSKWMNEVDREDINSTRISTLVEEIENNNFSPLVSRDEFSLYRQGYEG